MLCITYCPISFARIIPTHTNFSLATVLLSLAKLEKDLGNRISSVQSLSQVRLFATPWTAARQASLSFTNSWSWWCPSNWWCHPTISSSVVPFSSCPQSFPASGSFPLSQFFTSGGQSIGVSASSSVLPMNIQDWFPFRSGLIWIYILNISGLVGSPFCLRDSQESSPTPQFKSISSSALSFLYSPTLTSIHDYWKKP